jgi:hypothetical protein
MGMNEPTHDDICHVAAQFHENRVEMAREIIRLRIELSKWESGEVFSQHAAQLYEQQREEIERLHKSPVSKGEE